MDLEKKFVYKNKVIFLTILEISKNRINETETIQFNHIFHEGTI